jgi:hypothetical protein
MSRKIKDCINDLAPISNAYMFRKSLRESLARLLRLGPARPNAFILCPREQEHLWNATVALHFGIAGYPRNKNIQIGTSSVHSGTLAYTAIAGSTFRGCIKIDLKTYLNLELTSNYQISYNQEVKQYGTE